MTEAGFDEGPYVVVVADGPAVVAVAEVAVRQASAQLATITSWAESIERMAAQARPAVLLIETIDVADAIVERILPELLAMVEAKRVVVTFAPIDRVDSMSNLLIGSDATLLCDPTNADRVAALLMAMQADDIVVRDNREEAVRLARISAEVARFTETLAQLTGAPQGRRQASERDPIVGDRRPDFGHPPGDDADVTAAELRRAIRARRLRDEMFGLPGLFEDPAWDMLLDLFAAELERRPVSVSSLCIAAAVAPTTALRWINKLIAVGLFERRPDSFDRRRAFVALTDRASSAMRDYMAAVRRGGLAVG